MAGDAVALRLDDVGAASKRHEVYGLTRVPLGPWGIPFPGNFLFLKYLPPIKRWGPYRELTAAEWEAILDCLEASGSRMTVAITAGWVEDDGRVVPFPRKFPAAAAAIREGVRRGRLEVANHGWTHCVLDGRRFRPRPFSGNREHHREFHDWLPEPTHRDHLARAQDVLGGFFGEPPVTLVPPGNAFSVKTLRAARALGLRYLSCRGADRHGAVEGITPVDDRDVLTLHDRDIVQGGVATLRRRLEAHGTPLVTVRDVGERRAGGARKAP